MDEPKRKISKSAFGAFRLVSIKEPGCPWEGCIWIRARMLEEVDTMTEEEANKNIIIKCPYNVPRMCFPADYPMVRSECKQVKNPDFRNEDGNCCFLFRYANESSYNCRLLVKSAEKKIYDKENL